MATKKRNAGFKKIVGSKGALHRQLGVPEDQTIPPGKKQAALQGKYGPVAKQRAQRAFKGVLKTGRQTATKNKARKRTKRNPIAKINNSATLYQMGNKK